MYTRFKRQQLQQLLAEFPAVAILGPRQVGKTTLALDMLDEASAAHYLDLESPADAARLADPLAYLQSRDDALVVIDEIQRKPELFPVLRGLIDQRRRQGRRVGQFLLLGPATGALLAQSAESLAGRIAYMELPPLMLNEVPVEEAEALWSRGGFPESLLARSDAASLRWRQQFVTTYLERDIPQLGPRIPAETLRRLWTMLAHEQGQLLNATRLATALAISGQTVTRYIDLLCDLMLVRRLPPWSGNVGKRLVRSPKVYVRDSGLVHALLGLGTLDDVLGHPVAGGSWEGWIIENLLSVLPLGGHAFFYRSSAGAELDLVLELPRGERWAIEIKRSTAPSLTQGFHIATADVGATARFVVYAGAEDYPMGDGIEAVSLTSMLQRLTRADATAAPAPSRRKGRRP